MKNLVKLFIKRSNPDPIGMTQNQPLSKKSYILWNHYKNNRNTEYAITLKPSLNYIYRFDNKYTLYGEEAWKLKNRIRWFKENVVLMSDNPALEKSIRANFKNFRSLETNEPNNEFNTYLTLRAIKSNFNFSDTSELTPIELPSKNVKLPKRYQHLQGGVNYGVLKNEEIISFAAAPYILNESGFSFAIIRSVETKLIERRQGLGTLTVGKLCESLFNQHKIQDIVLWVDKNNNTARKLYEKLGFIIEGDFYATYCDVK